MRMSPPLPGPPIRKPPTSMSTPRKPDADGPADRPIDQIGNYVTVPPRGTTEDAPTTGALVLTGADAVTLVGSSGPVTILAGQAIPDGVTLQPEHAYLFGPAHSG